MDNSYITILLVSVAIIGLSLMLLTKYLVKTENKCEKDPEFNPLVDIWEP